MEYYEEGALVRDTEISHLLPSMAAGKINYLWWIFSTTDIFSPKLTDITRE